MNRHVPQEPLIRALLDPADTLSIEPREWNDVLLRARVYGLLARLGLALSELGLLERIPEKARDHMLASGIAAESSQTAVRFELNRILRALRGVDVSLILLKGAAYVAAELPPARGRFVGDLDLMVPRDRIEEVERVLVAKGWAPSEMEEYDQRYYRSWMHEIPPLQHPERQTVIDIHHTIVPRTSRATPDAAALVADSLPLPGSRVRVLCPADMVLHSSVHLFNDEVGSPVRDLFDLHDLLGHFGGEDSFWEDLLARCRVHGLERPLYYMLRTTSRMLGTHVPADVLVEAARAGAPGRLRGRLMEYTFTAAFIPQPPEHARTSAVLARWALYLRSHWLRMPPLMLARHLSIKAARRLRDRFRRGDEEQ